MGVPIVRVGWLFALGDKISTRVDGEFYGGVRIPAGETGVVIDVDPQNAADLVVRLDSTLLV
jgi:hypothetical protein